MASADILSLDNADIDKVMLSRASERISRELEGETVILDMESGVYSGLDEIGTRIWNLLEAPVTFGALRLKLLEEYDVSEAQCSLELLDFLQDLAANKLIIIHDR